MYGKSTLANNRTNFIKSVLCTIVCFERTSGVIAAPYNREYNGSEVVLVVAGKWTVDENVSSLHFLAFSTNRPEPVSRNIPDSRNTFFTDSDASAREKWVGLDDGFIIQTPSLARPAIL